MLAGMRRTVLLMRSRLVPWTAPRPSIFWRCCASLAPGRVCTITSMNSLDDCGLRRVCSFDRLASSSGESLFLCPKAHVVSKSSRRTRLWTLLVFLDVMGVVTFWALWLSDLHTAGRLPSCSYSHLIEI